MVAPTYYSSPPSPEYTASSQYAPKPDHYRRPMAERREEEIIFDLTERISKREEELRTLAKLNEQLLKRQRELEMENDELQVAVESLRDTVEEQQQLLSRQEEKLVRMDDSYCNMEEGMRQELESIDIELKSAVRSKNEALEELESKTHQIMALKDMVEDLKSEVDHHKGKHNDSISIITRMEEEVHDLRYAFQKHERIANEKEEEIRELSRQQAYLYQRQRELQTTVDAQALLLEQKDEEIAVLDSYCNRSEERAEESMEKMRQRLKQALYSKDIALAEDDAEIEELLNEICHYEYVAEKQVRIIRANEQKIKDLEGRDIDHKTKAEIDEQKIATLKEENAKLRAYVIETRDDGCKLYRGCGGRDIFDDIQNDLVSLTGNKKGS
mmetsp:Transcript_9693/g.21084  ORF Transcript_9693/g.21084 Transcript_9693/m.21084 type:complete len:385 (-) Transcript_9693:218-1372(-)